MLARKPAMSNSIEYLAKHAEVAGWIRTGLTLHVDKDKCEFCGNQLQPGRLELLRAHFSKDLELLEGELKQKNVEIQKLKQAVADFHKGDFYPQLRDSLEQAQSELNKSISSYNDFIDTLTASIDAKLVAPFQQVECPRYDEGLAEAVIKASKSVNSLIKKNNEITDTYVQETENAKTTLKRHFAAEFCLKGRLQRHRYLVLTLGKHKSWYEQAGKRISARNAELQAQISQAQKGREVLNAFIAKFLVGSNVSVSVMSVDGTERFQLLRDAIPAKNLSEGERTAIAYAFFLIKLKEASDLS